MQQPISFSELRRIEDDIHRGLIFEQAIREFVPWDYKPPIPLRTKTEQIDAFFTWSGYQFLVECKAKKLKITPGSHDWEDYELKLRKRGGSCIGIFFSLFELGEELYKEATRLNECNITNIVIAGSTFDFISSAPIETSDLIRFLISQARGTRETRLLDTPAIIEKIVDIQSEMKQIRMKLKSLSTAFLRRYKSPRHNQTYVRRRLDDEIDKICMPLRPEKLIFTEAKRTYNGTYVKTQKDAPEQIALIRDLSGAGKTTAAVNIADESDNYFGVSRAAFENNIDNIYDYLDKIGPDFGIKKLILSNRPIVYVVDSLDEATSIHQKPIELKSILKNIGELNKVASKYGLRGFPILFIFTIRDDYWRDWESYFEGFRARIFTRYGSIFTKQETYIALDRYQNAYEYSFTRPITDELFEALRHPFTLQIFSEANEYAGSIDPTAHMGSRVLELYFNRKMDDTAKRPIPGFDGKKLLSICKMIAEKMVLRNKNFFSYFEIGQLVSQLDSIGSNYINDVVKFIISEQIIVQDLNRDLYRFRHNKFLEFLCGLHIIELIKRNDIKAIDKLNKSIAATGFASIYAITDMISLINTDNVEFIERFDEIYSKSNEFMSKYLLEVRGGLVKYDSSKNTRNIKVAASCGNPSICLNAFFVLARKDANSDSNTLLDTFCLAWDRNKDSPDRWRMLVKLKKREIALNQKVVTRIIDSNNQKEIIVMMEQSKENGYFPEFVESVLNRVCIPREIHPDSDWAIIAKEVSNFESQN